MMQQEYRGHLCLLNRIGDSSCAPTGRLIQELAQALRERGWKVTVIAEPSAIRAALSLWRLGRGLCMMIVAAFRLQKPVSAVISMTDPPGLGLVGRMLAWLWRCPSIHWCQDLYPDMLIPQLGQLIRQLHPGHDRVVVPGPDMVQEHAIHVFNWPETAIVPKQLPDLVRGVRLLYSGNLGWVADLSALLEAWGRIKENVSLRICGHGSHLEKWQAYQNLPGISFDAPAPVEDLSEHLGRDHIHVVVIRKGAGRALMPMKFITAMAAGRPVLLLAEQDITLAKWVREENLGWVAPPDDPAAIHAALTEISVHPEKIPVHAAAAQSWYAAHQHKIGPDYLAGLITEWLTRTTS